MPIQKGKKMYETSLMDGEYPEKPDGPIEGTMWSDNIKGTIYDDTILADTGNDYVRAGVGNDTVFGGKGADELWGETGNDILHGEAGNDILYGGWGNDKLYGGTEDDELYGGFGADRLEGGDGNDYLDGGADAGVVDRMIGGPGDDKYVVEGGSDIVVEEYNGGNDWVELYQPTYTLPANVENIVVWVAPAPNTFITGNGLDNHISMNPWYSNHTVHAGAGNDYVRGGEGADELRGEGGDDKLVGEYGNDRLYGGTGLDRLIGGRGNDTLYGGTDADTFEFRNDEVGHDVIVDFQDGVDRLSLSGLKSTPPIVTTDADGDALIIFGTTEIELLGVSANQITAADWMVG